MLQCCIHTSFSNVVHVFNVQKDKIFIAQQCLNMIEKRTTPFVQQMLFAEKQTMTSGQTFLFLSNFLLISTLKMFTTFFELILIVRSIIHHLHKE